jgi:hypothetical protein
MTVILPHTFHDGTGEVISGVQVMDNLNALKAAVETVEGLAVLPSGSTYAAQVARTAGTTYVPNASKVTAVILEVGFGGPTGDFGFGEAHVGGVNVGTVLLPSLTGETTRASISFIAPPGTAWVYLDGRNTISLASSYLTF